MYNSTNNLMNKIKTIEPRRFLAKNEMNDVNRSLY